MSPHTFRVVDSLVGARRHGFTKRLARRCDDPDRADVLGELCPVIDAPIAEVAHIGTALAICERLEHLYVREAPTPRFTRCRFVLGSQLAEEVPDCASQLPVEAAYRAVRPGLPVEQVLA